MGPCWTAPLLRQQTLDIHTHTHTELHTLTQTYTHTELHTQMFGGDSGVVFPGFPGGAVVKNPPANAGDTGSSHGREDPT